MKKAFITGISGQDGSYLAEFLLNKGYEVHGIIRRHSVSENQTYRIDHLRSDLKLDYGDITDMSSLHQILSKNQFDEIYNLCAMSHVAISFTNPVFTTQTDYAGYLNLLEAIRHTQDLNKVKIYQAGTSEMFGNSIDIDGFQRESTRMNPVSPYAVAKLAAHKLGQNYREAYGMFISNGILFNHTSSRRGSNFVMAKICKEVIRIHKGYSDKLELGNIKSKRDIGHAKDYIKAMWLMLQQDKADDFVCSTGENKSIEEICEIAFSKVGKNYKDYISINEKYMRPSELKELKGDSLKLRTLLGWKPEYSFEDIITEMLEHYIKTVNS